MKSVAWIINVHRTHFDRDRIEPENRDYRLRNSHHVHYTNRLCGIPGCVSHSIGHHSRAYYARVHVERRYDIGCDIPVLVVQGRGAGIDIGLTHVDGGRVGTKYRNHRVY